ncbi:MAG TPA: CAP domain-containing protein [Actinomycetota bacterium]
MRSHKLSARLIVIALSSLLVMSLAAPAHAITRDEKDVAWRVNHEHYLRKLRSLAVWESLSNTARNHSCAMARGDRLYHNPSLTKQVRGWRMLGENVAVGWNLYEIHKAWMASRSHRDNILDGRYRALGVGICRGASGAYWVTTIFYR